MLNVTDGRPLSRALHAMLIGMVVAAGVTASALRSPAQAPAAAPAPTALPTFELGYLEDKCEAFLVARPGALLSRPDMKPVLDSLSASLGSVLTAIGLPANAIPLGDIDQVVGPVELKELSEAERKSMPNGERHSISLGVVFIRMNRDFDWAALLRSLPKAIPVTEKSPGEFELRAAFFGPNPMTIRVLDRRTIVGSSATAEEAAKRRSEIEQRFGAPLLHEVNQSGLAIVVDNDRSRWSETIRSNPKFQGAMTALGKPNHLALCLYWNDNVEASLVTDWDNPPSDPAGSKQTICAVLDKSLRSAKPTDDADRRMIALATELLKSVQIHQSGKLIKADMSTSMRWANLLDVMLHQSASVEAHEEKSKEKQ